MTWGLPSVLLRGACAVLASWPASCSTPSSWLHMLIGMEEQCWEDMLTAVQSA